MTTHQVYSESLERLVEILVAMDIAQLMEVARNLCQKRKYVVDNVCHNYRLNKK